MRVDRQPLTARLARSGRGQISTAFAHQRQALAGANTPAGPQQLPLVKTSSVETDFLSRKLLFASLMLVFCLHPPLTLAQGCPAVSTDASYFCDRGSNSQQYIGDIPTWFRVTRVVGPGTAGEFLQGQPDPRNNGYITPLSWSTYRQNGVVSKAGQITLSVVAMIPSTYYNALLGSALLGAFVSGIAGLPAGNLTFPPNGNVYVGSTQLKLPVTVNFSINGSPLRQMTFQVPVTSSGSTLQMTVCQTIPSAKLIKFARRLDSSGGTCTSSPRPGESTCPGVNEIDAQFIFNKGLERIGYAVGYNPFNVIAGADNLSFQALAPVLMAHGINANEQWFNNPSFGGSCTPSFVVGPSAFIQPFDQAKIPYALLADSPCALNSTGGMGQGTIPAVGTHMDYLVKLFAGTFGATKVHLVAHSKGGLWSRYALAQFPSYSWRGAPRSDAIGALSLTTLDTPHHGSVGADLKQAWLNSRWMDITNSIANNFPTVLLGYFGPRDSTQDLTVAGVEEFNRLYPVPPTAFQDSDGRSTPTLYRSISSDADNGNKVNAAGVRYVVANDVFPLQTGATAAAIGNGLYQIMGRTYSATLQGFLVRTLHTVPTQSFALNDLIVTRDSARYPVFQEVQQRVANHSSVGKNDVGLIVLQTVQGIQRVQ